MHAVAENVEEGAVPELDRRINPGGVAAQAFEALAVEGPAVDEDAAARWSVPPQEDADEARLAGARGTDDGDVGPRPRCPGRPY